MKNPCLICGYHLGGGDKNCHQCQECRDRLVYVRAIGNDNGMSIKKKKFLNELEELMPSSQQSLEDNPRIETKICKKCGKELLIDGFGRNAAFKDGRDSACKVCRKTMTDAARARKAGKIDRKSQGIRSEAMKKNVDMVDGMDGNPFLRLGRMLTRGKYSRGDLVEIRDLCRNVAGCVDTYFALCNLGIINSTGTVDLPGALGE